MRVVPVVGLLALIAFSVSPLRGDDAAKPDVKSDAAKPSAGEVRRQTLVERHFIYVETETTFAKMAETVLASLGKLDAAQKVNHAKYSGPTIFVYQGATMDPNKSFKLQIGYAVDDDVIATEGVRARKLDAFTCATSLFTGALDGMGPAIGNLMADAHVKGWKTTDEFREYYLYWEGEASENNVVLLAVGLK